MKATLTFNLPEEKEQFDMCLKGGDSHSALFEISNEVFRPARKHGYPDHDIHFLLESLNKLVEDLHAKGELPKTWPTDQYGPQNATDLIGLLESKFYNILQSQDVSI